MNKLTVAEVGQISELPAENGALALRVSLVRTAGSEIRRYLPNLPTIALERDSTDIMALCHNLQLFAPRALFTTSSPRRGTNRGGEGANR
ncbi:MAG TPA: hypothetical protein VGY91_00555 [Chthoniobacterales bacterium]|jgi:hypothetical protein|nr:hypothetical protein [Chthoniobacterales bacterium]